jgi:methyl-accepting chemotaxis protein
MATKQANSMPPASALRTTAELTTALGTLQNAEAEVTASLAALLASSEPINVALRRLSGLTTQLEEIGQDARLLHENVERTAKTADRVGSRVRALDEEMRRVREASERVNQVMELKVSPRLRFATILN